jgi:hypothetical protein
MTKHHNHPRDCEPGGDENEKIKGLRRRCSNECDNRKRSGRARRQEKEAEVVEIGHELIELT